MDICEGGASALYDLTLPAPHLPQARKEGNADVTAKLEQVLKIAMDEKQKTLRPEIQLLNQLLACDSPADRQKV